MNDRTDTKNERAGSRLKTDFLRCFRRQWHAKSRISSALIPAAVAVLVWLAFLFQRNVSGDMDRFVFFSTLYCFWIGLFNACQTLNGAVESGEWSYWVLGFRRSFARFFFANFLSTLTGTLMQTLVFLLALFALSFAGKFFVEANQILAVGAEPTVNALKGFLGRGVFFPKFLPSAVLLSVAFASATCCGAALGVLLSAAIRHSAAALKAAVAFVVLVMISSSLVLDEQKEYEYVSELLHGAPEAQATPFPRDGERTGKAVLSFVSFAFPQRYFFNVANCALSESLEREAEARAGRPETKAAWRALAKLGTDNNGGADALPRIRAVCVPELCGMLLRRVFGELAAMTLWSFAVLSLAFLFVKKLNPTFYEIR